VHMWSVGKLSARIVAMIFAVAMTYASFCSTTCGLGVCPNQERQSGSHDCDNPSHQHGPHQHGSGKSDCSAHYHPSVNLVKPDGLHKFGTDDVGIGSLFTQMPDATRFGFDLSSLFSLGSPPTPRSLLHQQISVLRI
jgi:hypothetical protein